MIRKMSLAVVACVTLFLAASSAEAHGGRYVVAYVPAPVYVVPVYRPVYVVPAYYPPPDYYPVRKVRVSYGPFATRVVAVGPYGRTRVVYR